MGKISSLQNLAALMGVSTTSTVEQEGNTNITLNVDHLGKSFTLLSIIGYVDVTHVDSDGNFKFKIYPNVIYRLEEFGGDLSITGGIRFTWTASNPNSGYGKAIYSVGNGLERVETSTNGAYLEYNTPRDFILSSNVSTLAGLLVESIEIYINRSSTDEGEPLGEWKAVQSFNDIDYEISSDKTIVTINNKGGNYTYARIAWIV